jgi:CubicO group peptidase (beta-lactamase class C family)
MKIKLLVISVFLFIISSCQFGRFIIYNFADINDYKKFPKRDLHANNKPFVFPKGRSEGARVPKGLTINGKEVSIESYLQSNKTVAFLIIHDDIIVYEKYFSGYDSASVVPSFSMAKSYTSALIGCAIDDGLIQSVDEPVTNYIPELKKNGFEKVTIKHLLQMTSGLDFNESYYDPFGDAAAFYYGKKLKENTLHLTLKRAPGIQFDYTSGTTQILGLVLERALKTENITHYFDRKIWFPLEMEFDGSWSIDKNDGMEKTFCCINARARDFAKFGRLYLNNGNWNGKQVISANWIKESTTPDVTNGGTNYYKYQWWLSPNDPGSFYAEGHLGQYIYVNPAKKLIIVRLGKGYGETNWNSLFSNYAATVE